MSDTISPELKSALDAAQKIRNKAGEEAKLRGECYEKSQKEFKEGDKAKAKELSEEGKKHDALVKKYNEEAADAFFAAHNKGKGDDEIDLHGLYVEEALERVNKRFERIGRKGTLVIIWGAGNHSEGGVRKIKPAVIELLNKEKVAFDDDTPNHGCCTVYFSGKKEVATPATPYTGKHVEKPAGKVVLPVSGEETEEERCCSCCSIM